MKKNNNDESISFYHFSTTFQGGFIKEFKLRNLKS